MDEWKKIGDKGELLENKWQEVINKKNPQIKNTLEKIFNKKELKDLESLIEMQKKNILKLNPIWLLDNVLWQLLKLFLLYYHK